MRRFLAAIRNTVALLFVVFVATACVTNGASRGVVDEAQIVENTERQRLRSLVDANMTVAQALHADDFQLLNPSGDTYTRDEYLGGVASGAIDYLFWEADSRVDVRVYMDSAVIRYRSRFEIRVDGRHIPRAQYWHTNAYEKRGGQWQVVWSQATALR